MNVKGSKKREKNLFFLCKIHKLTAENRHNCPRSFFADDSRHQNRFQMPLMPDVFKTFKKGSFAYLKLLSIVN
jgi:hypothetical protein